VRFVAEHQRDHAGEPFFMYVAFTAAHWPLHAPEEEIAKFKGQYDGGYEPVRAERLANLRKLGLIGTELEPAPLVGDWSKVEHKAWESRCREVYSAQVTKMDTGVGSIVGQLAKSGLLENTLVFYLQDNGGCAEEINRKTTDQRADKPTFPAQPPDFIRYDVRPKQTRDGFPVLGGPLVMPGPVDTFQSYGKSWANVSNTPFREYKHWVHEGGISTPLVAHWPAGIAARGELRTRPGHLVDIMATCLEVAGATLPKERAGVATTALEGESLVPSFQDAKAPRRGPIFWEHEGNRAVRAGDWKLVAKGPGGAWELYDMSKDRTELHDLASAEPDRLKQMVAQWETYAKRAQVLPWIWRPPYGTKEAPNPNQETPDLDDEAAGSRVTQFTWKSGDDVPGDRAPRLVGRGFRVSVEVSEMGKDGVLVAQGGSAHGWVLYAKEGMLNFAMRRAGKLHTVPGPALAVGKVSLTVRADGEVTLAEGDASKTGRLPGTLVRHPQDGLQVGRDAGGQVGEYTGEAAFSGKIGVVTLEVTK
jgi:arylsulfatase